MAEMTAEEERRFRDYGGKDHCGGLSTIEARKVWAALDAERLESARLREERDLLASILNPPIEGGEYPASPR